MNRISEIENILHRLVLIDETSLIVNSDWNDVADDIVRVSLPPDGHGALHSCFVNKAQYGPGSVLPAIISTIIGMLASTVYLSSTARRPNAATQHFGLCRQ
ncbi:unnamed protein product [Heligmosomoides polygyrus]|uniref:Uncharacterized protein n=1 Tax=Heligmosomoides polygyrus TaxID=6339 RepID=A0A183FP44_HELPZ|nr:unnamed protein product [Heligmosomoides polygyrus]